jgi:cellulose synthase (UDP-forming)
MPTLRTKPAQKRLIPLQCMPEYPDPDDIFLDTKTDKMLLFATSIMALVYFVFLAFLMPKGNVFLFYILIAGEVFHLWQILTYVYTVWEPKFSPLKNNSFTPPVDIYITVTGEPAEIIEETAKAALAMEYPNFTVYLLNDGYVAKKPNWREAETVAHRLGITCITRTLPGGAKAGNINNALRSTKATFVAIFDADQVPHRDFLTQTIPFLAEPDVGFVQSPQYYKNFNTNEITVGSWEQQELFFGAVCKGKNRLKSVFMCGTNMVVRKAALLQAGGMCETNIAEDFLTSLFMHEQGWKSVYVPKILAEGLAPEDFLSYYKQQFRWARGSLEVMFKYNPLFRRGLSWPQKIQYLASSSFYFSGLIVLTNALLPLIFFFTGWAPLAVSTMALAAIFLPYIFLVILTLQLTSNYSFTFRAIAFSMSSFTIHLQALWAVMTAQKNGFSVTSKKQLSGNFLYLTTPHILYLAVTLVGVAVAVIRSGISPAFLSNLSWALFNAALFSVFIVAAAPAKKNSQKLESEINANSLRQLNPPANNPLTEGRGAYSLMDIRQK